MSTGYHIEIGYNSAHNRDDAWTELKAVVERLRHQPDLIVAEVRREQPGLASDDVLRDYAESYGPDLDLTLKVIEAVGERRPEIYQSASGGGESRDIKEAMRRAFARLVIFEMHKQGIEVNFVVT